MFFYQDMDISPWYQKNLSQKPLQVLMHCEKKGKRASLWASNQGLASVEAAIVLPILICALCGMLMWGQALILNLEAEYALVEAGRQLARKEHMLSSKKNEGSSIYGAGALFRKNMGQSDSFDKLKVSGINFAGTKYDGRSKELRLSVAYKGKLPVLLLGSWQLRLCTAVTQKAWNGYAPANGEEGDGEGAYVYVTEDGEVYHTDGQCYHLHVTVQETEDTARYYDGETSYRPCEHCIKKGQARAGSLYIPKEGDCYHSDPACSGLTRTVRYVDKESVEGMRPCSHCGR